VESTVACHFIVVVCPSIAQNGQEVQVGVEARMIGVWNLDSLKKRKKERERERWLGVGGWVGG